MAQIRNDEKLSVDYVADFRSDLPGTVPASPATAKTINTGAGTNSQDDELTNLKGAKGSEELNTVTGWEVQNNSIPLEGYAGPDVGSLAGGQTYPESSLTFLSDDASNTLFDLLQPGTAAAVNPGIVFGRFGRTVGGFWQLFPARPASLEISKGRNVPATFTVNFSLNAPITGTFVAAA